MVVLLLCCANVLCCSCDSSCFVVLWCCGVVVLCEVMPADALPCWSLLGETHNGTTTTGGAVDQGAVHLGHRQQQQEQEGAQSLARTQRRLPPAFHCNSIRVSFRVCSLPLFHATVAQHTAHNNTPDTTQHHHRQSAQVHRYQPPEVSSAVAALSRARESVQIAGKAAWLSFLGSAFSRHYSLFRGAATALAQLDALCSLGVVACNDGYTRPEILPEGNPPEVSVVAGRHPMLDRVLAGDSVPNDVALSGEGTRCLVITGPNMVRVLIFARLL